jgi:hypothetical protein
MIDQLTIAAAVIRMTSLDQKTCDACGHPMPTKPRPLPAAADYLGTFGLTAFRKICCDCTQAKVRQDLVGQIEKCNDEIERFTEWLTTGEHGPNVEAALLDLIDTAETRCAELRETLEAI